VSIFIYFLVALILSFIGSIPIGLITLNITQRTIQDGRKAGLMVAFGATVMEFIYTGVALVSLDFLNANNKITQSIKIAAIIVFFVIGLYYLLKKNSEIPAIKTDYNYLDFFKGIVIGALNMLIIPFWIFLGLWLKSNGFFFEDQFTIFIFSMGAAIGALLAFLGYIWLSEYVNTRSKQISAYTNKAVGILFLGLAIFQLLSM